MFAGLYGVDYGMGLCQPARFFRGSIPASVLVFVNSWIQFISWLPIQVFGGLGVAETSQIYLYGLFGIPASQMATVSVGLRVILYLFNLISLLYLPSQTFFRRKNFRFDSPNERSE